MSADLTTLLTQAEGGLERSVAAADDVLTDRLRAAVSRRRRARHVREAVGGLAVLAVIGGASWAVAVTDPPPAPTLTSPSPTPTARPTPTPSTPSPTAVAPTPTSTPSVPDVDAGPPVRESAIDDALVLARLSEPRTGEVWVAPERAPELDARLAPDGYHEVWHVGRRGESTIYLVVDAGASDARGVLAVPSEALYEVDAAGARAIVCPSARIGDWCVSPDDELMAPRDEATFYDSLTLPEWIDLGDGWLVSTGWTRAASWYGPLGQGQAFYGSGPQERLVADLGPVQVVETIAEGALGMSHREYALRTPLGTTVGLSADDAPSGEFGSIRWDDGVARPLTPTEPWVVQSTSPAGGACFSGTFAVDPDHVAGDWRPAGTTPGGHRVHVPVAGGNAVSRAVRAWHEEHSFSYDESYEPVSGAAAGYPYLTDEAFLAANALYAIQGPTGEWQLRLRSDALAITYECA